MDEKQRPDRKLGMSEILYMPFKGYIDCTVAHLTPDDAHSL